jgi:hypothetical protein
MPPSARMRVNCRNKLWNESWRICAICGPKLRSAMVQLTYHRLAYEFPVPSLLCLPGSRILLLPIGTQCWWERNTRQVVLPYCWGQFLSWITQLISYASNATFDCSCCWLRFCVSSNYSKCHVLNVYLCWMFSVTQHQLGWTLVLRAINVNCVHHHYQ